MGKINVLDKHTAELIAAGEVVERPASVVKELVENSIDAGATQITVAIENGGVSLIQISDNGSGIDSTDIPTAFVRHATSKIKKEEDLESIHTLGFRGEALASIASVAKVELLTKTEVDEFACHYEIHGGEEQGIEAAARPVGTTISIHNLFYNTPARMKFLKKDSSEGNYVSDVITQLALSHPEISFKFIRERKLDFQTSGDGILRGAVYSVLGRDFASDLIEVSHENKNYSISGLISPVHSARASRAMQYFFVNGRYVKNRTIMAALEQAYKGLLMQGRFPGCILSINLPAELVDVNVHPAKTEIRFANEKDVFDVVYQAVKAALVMPKAYEKTLTIDEQPAFTQNFENQVIAQSFTPQKSVFTIKNHAETPTPIQTSVYNQVVKTLASEPVVEYKRTVIQDDLSSTVLVETEQAETSLKEQILETADLQYIGEIFDTYIITQRNDDICFIDKHAAHERALYEKLMAQYGKVSSQTIMIPISVRLSAEEKNALLDNSELIFNSGIEIEDFGGNTVLIRAVPADVEPNNIENLIIEIAEKLSNHSKDSMSEKTEWVLHSISCRAAIKAGDKNNSLELLKLAKDVLDGKIPPFCPHGRPVILKLTKKEIEKQFGRQG